MVVLQIIRTLLLGAVSLLEASFGIRHRIGLFFHFFASHLVDLTTFHSLFEPLAPLCLQGGHLVGLCEQDIQAWLCLDIVETYCSTLLHSDWSQILWWGYRLDAPMKPMCWRAVSSMHRDVSGFHISIHIFSTGMIHLVFTVVLVSNFSKYPSPSAVPSA